MRYFQILLALLLVFMLAGCEEIEEEKAWIQQERPQMLFSDTTLMDSYDKGILSWKLKTAYLERWEEKGYVFIRPVLVDIYDSLGERVAFLRADSGRMDTKFTYVNAFGHVYAITPKGASIRADSLLWNKRSNQVRTDSYVRVVSEDGDVLQGKGFESDAKMDNWKIVSDVTGIFQDAATRIKEEDKKQAQEIEKKDEKKEDRKSPASGINGSLPVAKQLNAQSSQKSHGKKETKKGDSQKPEAVDEGKNDGRSSSKKKPSSLRDKKLKEMKKRKQLEKSGGA